MTKQQTFKQLKFIFLAISIGLIIFFGLAVIFVKANGKVMDLEFSAETNLKSLLILLALVGIPASYMFHQRIVKRINKELPENEKLIKYKRAFFVKIITLEGLSFLSLLVYMATAQLTYLSIFGILFFTFLINYPRKESILMELEIEPTEINN